MVAPPQWEAPQGRSLDLPGWLAEGEPGAAGDGPDDTAEVLGLKPVWRSCSWPLEITDLQEVHAT